VPCPNVAGEIVKIRTNKNKNAQRYLDFIENPPLKTKAC
jgi:hypothetical protein